MKLSLPSLSRFDFLLPWVALAILASFTYVYFIHAPYAGFEFETDGRVSLVYAAPPSAAPLQVGDRVVQVGQVSWGQFRADLSQPFFAGARPGDLVPLQVERDGRLASILWRYPGPTPDQLLHRLTGVWWLAYVFWFAGTATVFFLRPKDTSWKLLVTFNYLTALGLVSGGYLSHWHVGQSALVLRAAVWLALPIYLHFHWIFPRRLAPLPRLVWLALYALAVFFVLAQWFQRLSSDLFFLGFIAVVSACFLLLLLHLVFQPEFRRDLLALLVGILVVLAPPLATSFYHLSGQPPTNFQQAVALLTLPGLPGIYFFMVYRHQFRRLETRVARPVRIYLLAFIAAFGLVVFYSVFITRFETLTSHLGLSAFAILLAALIALVSFYPFVVLPALTGASYGPVERLGGLVIRPNRLVTSFLFFVCSAALLTFSIVLADRVLAFPGKTIVLAMGAALLAGTLVAFTYRPFLRFIERRILNMPLPPTRLLQTYASRITTSLNRDDLIHLLKDEVLPSLLVRQSALLWIESRDASTPLFTAGVKARDLPDNGDIPVLLTSAGEYHGYQSNPGSSQIYPWVRLVLPLKLGPDLIGLWLLGDRDPDDFYAPAEITILQALADQTAIALTNIHQSEQLRGLYQANIIRQETERKHLALFLHDEVLNQLAGLSMQIDRPGFAERFLQTQQSLNTSIRQIISGLRPMMLNYGLGPALEELVENLTEQSNGDVKFEYYLDPFDARYDPDCEAHLYWIVHQACENALQHARPDTVRIHGQLHPGHLVLSVQDDGAGFENGDSRDLLDLFDERRYGLVGMHERAAIIAARLTIDSKVGHGTRVTVTCNPRRPHA